VVDRATAGSPLTLISACSGHGFKHSAAIGETVATSIISPESLTMTAAFRIDRFSNLSG
jgi:sarcosine oxidase